MKLIKHADGTYSISEVTLKQAVDLANHTLLFKRENDVRTGGEPGCNQPDCIGCRMAKVNNELFEVLSSDVTIRTTAMDEAFDGMVAKLRTARPGISPLIDALTSALRGSVKG